MKNYFLFFFLLVVVLASYPFMDRSEHTGTIEGLPWQIDIQPDGQSQVFGLAIGKTRLAEALAILGEDKEMAVVAASDEVGSLEVYYGHYRAGLLSGKLILLTDSDEQDIKRWRENAVNTKYMATGAAKKYFLSKDDLFQAAQETISAITFIPAVNLKPEVIVARFGEPDRKVRVGEATHYLYPAKGLDLVFHEQAKEVLQYVSPLDFDDFIQPLQQPD